MRNKNNITTFTDSAYTAVASYITTTTTSFGV